MMKSIFVTGTDTGVGKTTISACLSAFLSLKRKLNVGVMKPFESGLSKRNKDELPWDAICLKEASGSSDDLNSISPYTFEAPLAPEVAASLENVKIDLNMVDRIYKKILNEHDIVVIEGAGGVLVPIKKNFFYGDLIKRWGCPTLIVSRLGLGTINHTLLTVGYLKTRGIKIIGVILNNNDGTGDLAAKTNPTILSNYLDCPILGTFPYKKNLLRDAMNRQYLARLFATHVDTEKMLNALDL
ncbi:MAG TPA: dethiobiotin synthase [Syntrophorhabdaceae bacterium]|nr:dethiobiotin synthase [Syntrophorhabdaceae bacterium]HPU29991.1 dethiobiotin synthase [Syntrophorhabdaceae bacterium]